MWSRRLCTVAIFLLGGMLPAIMAQRAEPIDLGEQDDRQYSFLDPLLRNVEVVSLSESIHMTHEFPLARLGVVRRLNGNSGFNVLAFEGSPEDVWVSQDAFLKNQGDLHDSTSGLFGIWNTDEMRAIFAYERDSWSTGHGLYVTAYDIQPGTGKGSGGERVFEMLQEHLAQYAPPPSGLKATTWNAALIPLTAACTSYKSSDKPAAEQAIGILEQWIAVAAPRVDAAYPTLPMHAEALRLIPQNLRMSLSLCETVGGSEHGSRNWQEYKQSRDRLSAQFAMLVKNAAPKQRLILWAHLSHLSYDADGTNTSVGELLHQALGPKLYSIGTFATGGGTIVLFSDVNEDFGYTRLSGISKGIRVFTNEACAEVCFTDLHNLPAGSPLAGRQSLWVEAKDEILPLTAEVDGVIWVKDVHPPRLPLLLLFIFAGKHYIPHAIALMVLLAGIIVWRAYRRRQRRTAR